MSNASEYADSVAASIREDCDRGTPFGVADEWNTEWSSDTLEGEELSAYDWLDSALDVQYLVGGDGTYRAARVLIAFGGPNAWVDTRTSQLEVSWWSAPEFRELPAAFIDALDDALSELWQCR